MSSPPRSRVRLADWPIVVTAFAWTTAMLVTRGWPWLQDERLPLGALLVWVSWTLVTLGAARIRSPLEACAAAAFGAPLVALGAAYATFALFAWINGERYWRETGGHYYDIGEHFELMQLGCWPAFIGVGLGAGALAATAAHARSATPDGRAWSAIVVAVASGIALTVLVLARSWIDLPAMLDDWSVIATNGNLRAWLTLPPLAGLATAAAHAWRYRRGRAG